MKFREEVMEKIFTYITIILLMAAVAFEAWSVYSERNERKEAEETVAALQDDLSGMMAKNISLQKENKELAAFRKTWATYAAFVGEKEVLYFKTDLFSRTDLIPQEALEALEEKHNTEREEDEEKVVLEASDFSFDNPDGENIFLPLSMATGDIQSCLIYTMAYGKEDAIELLYEINFESLESSADRDENGEILWKCVAYSVGEGWQGMQEEETKR